jgi:hypothetical protein
VSGVRYVGGLTFTHMEPGLWQCEVRTSAAADANVLRWELERRRYEPGCDAGWYVFGPGTEGRRAGGYLKDAMDLVRRLADSMRPATDEWDQDLVAWEDSSDA